MKNNLDSIFSDNGIDDLNPEEKFDWDIVYKNNM